MTKFVVALFAVMLLAAPQLSLAADSMMMTMPKCAAGDRVVGVNMQTKMYMTHDQMKTKMMGMSNSQMHAMMMKHHIKMMCESQAKSMGASMMRPRMASPNP